MRRGSDSNPLRGALELEPVLTAAGEMGPARQDPAPHAPAVRARASAGWPRARGPRSAALRGRLISPVMEAADKKSRLLTTLRFQSYTAYSDPITSKIQLNVAMFTCVYIYRYVYMFSLIGKYYKET